MQNLKKFTKAKWLAIFCLLISFQSTAQMKAAKGITFDIDTTVKFNVSVSVLWDTLKEPSKWAGFSNGHIQFITVSGNLPGQSRVLYFSDGTERKDIVTQHQPEHRFIVIRVTDPLSPGIRENILTYTCVSEGKGLSRLDMRIKVEGDENEKIALLNVLRNEMYGYIGGLTKLFSEG